MAVQCGQCNRIFQSNDEYGAHKDLCTMARQGKANAAANKATADALKGMQTYGKETVSQLKSLNATGKATLSEVKTLNETATKQLEVQNRIAAMNAELVKLNQKQVQLQTAQLNVMQQQKALAEQQLVVQRASPNCARTSA
jgi:hypothetical protein